MPMAEKRSRLEPLYLAARVKRSMSVFTQRQQSEQTISS